MGFNKRYISKESLKNIATDEYIKFYNYFISDAILFEDTFSLNIMKELKQYSITDKDNILKIMQKCK